MIKDFIYTIKRVKDLSFFVNEKLFVADPNKIIKIELGQMIGFSLESDTISFLLRIYYHYEGSPNDILVDIQVENIFAVENLTQFQLENKIIILPEMLISSIVSMSLSHGRALMQRNTAGTIFQDVIVPILNSVEVAKHFFPYMFDKETTVTQLNAQGAVLNEGLAKPNKKNRSKASAADKK